jgi:hypothetical protein
MDAAAAERRERDCYRIEAGVSAGVGVGMAAVITAMWIGVTYCVIGAL